MDNTLETTDSVEDSADDIQNKSSFLKYTFPAKVLLRSPIYTAVHGAVIFPLANKDKFAGIPVADRLGNSYTQVLNLWRRRLYALSQVSSPWAPLQAVDRRSGHKSAAYRYTVLANCRPFGGHYIPGATGDSIPCCACQRARLCPWCYGREIVANIFASVAFALFGGRKTSMPGVQLLATRWFGDYPDLAALVADLPARRATLWTSLGSRSNQVLGEASVVTMAPIWPSPAGKSLRLTLSSVLLLPDGFVFPLVEPGRQTFSVLSTELRFKDILNAVKLTTLYPIGLLRGSPELVTDILTTMTDARFRMYSNSGMLRNEATRKLYARYFVKPDEKIVAGTSGGDQNPV